MEDIGDIIYLFLLIAFILFGGFGKKGKKKKVQQRKAATSHVPNSQKNLEKKLRDIASPQPRRQTVAPGREVRRERRPSPEPMRPRMESKFPKSPSKTIYTPKREQSIYDILSYDTVDDVSKLRVKKQIRESVSKKQSVFKSTKRIEVIEDTSFNPIDIELDNVQDARKAFIYSEIFNRKYS